MQHTSQLKSQAYIDLLKVGFYTNHKWNASAAKTSSGVIHAITVKYEKVGVGRWFAEVSSESRSGFTWSKHAEKKGELAYNSSAEKVVSSA